MVTIIKKGDTGISVSKKLGQVSKRKPFHAEKYCGVISLKESPLKIQKKLRNEWK